MIDFAPKHYHALIEDIQELAKVNEIDIQFSSDKLVYVEGEDQGCAGYFSDEPLILRVATGKPIENWIKVLIHESCHMDQYLEDNFIWTKCQVGYTTFFQWLSGEIELASDKLDECVQDIIRLEKDCEERAVNKIKQYQLPINIMEYIQQANAYLYSYLLFREKRIWIPELYYKNKAWKYSPKEFKAKYLKIPKPLEKAFLANT